MITRERRELGGRWQKPNQPIKKEIADDDDRFRFVILYI